MMTNPIKIVFKMSFHTYGQYTCTYSWLSASKKKSLSLMIYRKEIERVLPQKLRQEVDLLSS